MTDQVVIYVTPPSTDRGPWRVRSDHRPVDERPTEAEAIRLAVTYVQMIEHAGGIALVKVERPDGTWEAFHA